MERLTYRSTRFNNPVSNGACEKIKCSAKCDSCKINDLIAKLCAYEDTGLEPEEIIGLKNTCEQLSGINDSLFKANQEMGKDLAEWKKAVECAWGDGCGKDWFFTREEAEAALALKGGEG